MAEGWPPGILLAESSADTPAESQDEGQTLTGLWAESTALLSPTMVILVFMVTMAYGEKTQPSSKSIPGDELELAGNHYLG